MSHIGVSRKYEFLKSCKYFAFSENTDKSYFSQTGFYSKELNGENMLKSRIKEGFYGAGRKEEW